MEDLDNDVGAQQTDLIFLGALMESPVMQNLIKAHDKLEDQPLKPVLGDNIQLLENLVRDLQNRRWNTTHSKELAQLLNRPHFRALIEAHDIIAQKKYERNPTSNYTMPPMNSAPPIDAIRMVGIRKVEGEPLGMTVTEEQGELVIARILQGGLIDKQGLLHVGDVIKEVNNIEVRTPEELQTQIKKAAGSLTLKIVPSYEDQKPAAQVYVKAHFNYEPYRDTLIPCKEAGLSFHKGEILQIVNQEDPNWWQAKKVGDNRPAALIPSQKLEESRKAFCKPEHDFTKTVVLGSITAKRKKKVYYNHQKTVELDRHELLLYEEVARMPPFQRKTLILVAAQGVGRRSLKSRLINSDPDHYGTTIPHTSRPMRIGEEDGKRYFFTDRAIMERDINEDQYLESGELDGNLYGTKLDTIRQIIRSGKMCILDCNPTALKRLHTPEFMPYIVFFAAPDVMRLKYMHDEAARNGLVQRNISFERQLQNRSMTIDTLDSEYSDMTEEDFNRTVNESYSIQRNYDRFFDLTIVNDDFEKTFVALCDAIHNLSIEPQWVPISWVY